MTPFPRVNGVSICIADLKRYIAKIHQWLVRWTETGGCEIIHPRLYSVRFPRCVQDAWLTLSCYLSRTSENEDMVFRIVEERARALIREWERREIGFEVDGQNDPFVWLSRVHALFVYQVICLYDGDIRLRHLAESNIPLLYSWLRGMLECVEEQCRRRCLGHFVVTPMQESRFTSDSCPPSSRIAPEPVASDHRDNLLWYSWILAENIRRTWLVAQSLQTIYAMIQLGQISQCPGTMMFSTRQGVWEAKSARAWEDLCVHIDVGFVHMKDTESVFLNMVSPEVNDSTKVFLETTFGQARSDVGTIQSSKSGGQMEGLMTW